MHQAQTAGARRSRPSSRRPRGSLPRVAPPARRRRGSRATGRGRRPGRRAGQLSWSITPVRRAATRRRVGEDVPGLVVVVHQAAGRRGARPAGARSRPAAASIERPPTRPPARRGARTRSTRARVAGASSPPEQERVPARPPPAARAVQGAVAFGRDRVDARQHGAGLPQQAPSRRGPPRPGPDDAPRAARPAACARRRSRRAPRRPRRAPARRARGARISGTGTPASRQRVDRPPLLLELRPRRVRDAHDDRLAVRGRGGVDLVGQPGQDALVADQRGAGRAPHAPAITATGLCHPACAGGDHRVPARVAPLQVALGRHAARCPSSGDSVASPRLRRAPAPPYLLRSSRRRSPHCSAAALSTLPSYLSLRYGYAYGYEVITVGTALILGAGLRRAAGAPGR